MPKYVVYGIIAASKRIGEFEADTEEEAIALAMDDENADSPTLCHQCADKVDLGDIYEFQADAVEGY